MTNIKPLTVAENCARAGSVKSPAKSAAARQNLAKGRAVRLSALGGKVKEYKALRASVAAHATISAIAAETGMSMVDVVDQLTAQEQARMDAENGDKE